MSFAKTVTLDQKTIDFINFLMEELNIENFSQALRIAVTYATIYKKKTGEREDNKSNLIILRFRLEESMTQVKRADNIFSKIQTILIGRWSDKQKVAKLKEIL